MVVSVYARGTNNPRYQDIGNGGEIDLKG